MSFEALTKKVIDTNEGGYYHPDMMNDGRVKYDSRYLSSGETMFGIDRKNGGALNTSPAGLKFWAEIDKAGARKLWKWNYRGGTLEGKLTDLAIEVMRPHYNSLAKKHLIPSALQVVNNDPRLLYHFIYAAWNGPGWFKKFAAKINEAVSNGITDKEKLAKIALDSRINSGNSLIAQGGGKVALLFEQLKNQTA